MVPFWLWGWPAAAIRTLYSECTYERWVLRRREPRGDHTDLLAHLARSYTKSTYA